MEPCFIFISLQGKSTTTDINPQTTPSVNETIEETSTKPALTIPEVTTDEENPTLQSEKSPRIPLTQHVENMLERLREQRRSQVCVDPNEKMDTGICEWSSNKTVSFIFECFEI